MRLSVCFVLIVSCLSAEGKTSSFKLLGEKRNVEANRVVVNDLSRFVKRCVGTNSFPTLSETQVRVEEDTLTKQYFVTAAFKADADTFLKTETKLVDVEPDNEGVRNVSLAVPLSEKLAVFTFQLKSGSEVVDYRLETETSGERTTLVPAFTDAQQKEICLRNQIWAGVGGSLFSFDQTSQLDETSADLNSFKLGSYHIEGRLYPTKRLGFTASFKNAPGNVPQDKAANTSKTPYSWTIAEVAAQYRQPNWVLRWNRGVIYPYLRFGLQSHSMPRLAFGNDFEVNVDHLNFMDASIGAGFNAFFSRDHFFESHLNIKKTVWNGGSGVQPDGAQIDGAAGIGYALNKHVTIGAYWYLYSEKVSYQSKTGLDTNPGTLNFFFSNFDFRIGYLF